MGNFKGVNQTYKDSVPSVKVPVGEVSADIQFARDEYTTLVNAVAADTFQMGITIPVGRRVVRVVAIVPANGGTMDVGIAGSTTKYIAAAAANATTEKAIDVAPSTVEENILCTIGGSPSATGRYVVQVYHCKV